MLIALARLMGHIIDAPERFSRCPERLSRCVECHGTHVL
jgi:hypothetical protein